MLFVVRRVLYGVWCSLFIARSVLFIVYWFLFVVSYPLYLVVDCWCSWCVDCYLLYVVCCC